MPEAMADLAFPNLQRRHSEGKMKWYPCDRYSLQHHGQFDRVEASQRCLRWVAAVHNAHYH